MIATDGDAARWLLGRFGEPVPLFRVGCPQWQPFASAPADGTVVLVAWIDEERCRNGVSYSMRGEPDMAKFWVTDAEPHWRTTRYSDPLEVDTECDGLKTYANPPTHDHPLA